MNRKAKIGLYSGITALIVAFVVAAYVICMTWWAPILELYLGKVGVSDSENSSSFTTDYEDDDEYAAARKELCRDLEGEGAVLLKNDNGALPVSSSAKISLFGVHSVDVKTGGSGSGAVSGADSSRTLKVILEELGVTVNPELNSLYEDNISDYELGGGPALSGSSQTTDDWTVNELPISYYGSDVQSSYSSYDDAAFVLISRTGGEGGDLPTDMSSYGGTSDEHYLELTGEEKDLLEEVTSHFDRVAVILNTMNAMELGFLDEYGIDACLWIGGTGADGLDAVGQLLVGERNPSGHLVDTYVYDNFSSPASQNFGDYTFSNADYSYVTYSEGIYVGYRYYETRYEDSVLGADTGSFDYDSVVAYPFGYGMSYTDFEWSGYSCEYDSGTDSYLVSVTVKNSGSAYSGKDVVEVYAQKPYTAGGTEKSAVDLVGFAKTSEIEPGGSETVSVSVPRRELTSYDYTGAGTYVLDAGDYYITAAGNAHEAAQNILAEKTDSVDAAKEGMTECFALAADAETYSTDAYTGTAIGNLFDYSTYDGMAQLSRQDWKAADSGLEVTDLSLSDADQTQHETTGKEGSNNPDTETVSREVTVAADGNRDLTDYMDTEYDSDEWYDLIQQVTLSNLNNSFCSSGYRTIEIEEIGKPECTDSDGPAGIQSFVSGASSTVSAYGYVIPTVVACTWNTELAGKEGDMVGEDGLRGGVSGWYAPAMDTHRTPFGGRNFEYYSEDGLIGGKIAAAVVSGAQAKGLYCYIKHFAINEQDTNRGWDLLTWVNEQAMREIYFKPFQIAVQEGGALGVMTAQDCIGAINCYGNYNLITDLLKEEWGFKGICITDYSLMSSAYCEQILYAGGDCILQTQLVNLSSRKETRTQIELQRALRSILYVTVHSNGITGSTGGIATYQLILIGVDVLAAAGIFCLWFFGFAYRKKEKKSE